ncbi:conserved hypothetical protein [Microsporum canis CBS 113480]|uniref:SAP domain-containing protein n=1 Tax=Arthroderma otae (strain ATCC MYA-4605 / CBS 113480) TaxID=554155 RepID=C5FEK2_ARTOC|nr:conserved hypothetical protein [Microsporum canis CBS 113480]EEQ28326.1 conserved hypothetical protein [Microsporum canis CBS 113480]
MAARRSTSLKALRSLSQQPRRSLHITGAYSAQVATGPDVSTLYHSRTLADLRAECQKRNLGASGTKSELVDRLSNHDVLQSRAFSIAMRRIDRHAFGQQSASRPFNTSRANSPMSEVVDNHALELNPFNLTEAVSRSRDGARASAARSRDYRRCRQGPVERDVRRRQGNESE